MKQNGNAKETLVEGGGGALFYSLQMMQHEPTLLHPLKLRFPLVKPSVTDPFMPLLEPASHN